MLRKEAWGGIWPQLEALSHKKMTENSHFNWHFKQFLDFCLPHPPETHFAPSTPQELLLMSPLAMPYEYELTWYKIYLSISSGPPCFLLAGLKWPPVDLHPLLRSPNWWTWNPCCIALVGSIPSILMLISTGPWPDFCWGFAKILQCKNKEVNCLSLKDNNFKTNKSKQNTQKTKTKTKNKKQKNKTKTKPNKAKQIKNKNIQQ